MYYWHKHTELQIQSIHSEHSTQLVRAVNTLTLEKPTQLYDL